jgi:hypothetical protein
VTDKERLALVRQVERELTRTGQGYVQWSQDKQGGHWPKALAGLTKLERDFQAPPVPDLGPVWDGGKSVLLHDLTHATSGIPLYPAFDDAFNQGRVIIAPEKIEVGWKYEDGKWIRKLSSANPGAAFYARGVSDLGWWFGHLDRAHPLGTKFAKGDAIGRVAANNIGGGPHAHVGINSELILGPGKQFLHHTNYTHGAPTVGVQLAKALTWKE